MPEPVSRLAPAKINLYLHVTGRRADGYHLIDSLFAFTDFGDRIDVRPGNRGIRLTVEGPFADCLSSDADNLVIRAATALAASGNGFVDPSAEILLTKTLPVASGIGGGSSDAAATLTALSRFWGIDASPETLTALAAGLGADVPACLYGAPVQVSGVGEQLAPSVRLPACAVVLANPGEPLITADVFRAFAAAPAYSVPAPLTKSPASVEELVDVLSACRNDLEAAAKALVPAINGVLDALADLPGCLLARLSGSGPTCFGLFASSETAAAAARALASVQPGWWVQSGSLLGSV